MSKVKQITDDQVLQALNEAAGNVTEAAKRLGIGRRTLQRRLALRRADPDSGFAGKVWPVMPEGQRLRGVSSFQKVVDPDTGEVVSQWVKTERDRADDEAMQRELLEAFLEKIPRAPKLAASRKVKNEDLANLHILTDYHLGMLAWGEECGEPWDLKIAEDLLVKMFAYGLANSPAATQGLLAQLGDFTHYDSFESITPTSKHLLDSDSRPQKMVRVALRVLRRVIDMMLKKYDTVYVLMAEGNHDIMSSAWLREAFALFYENEPRVTVEVRPDPYYAFLWGQTLLFFHHGHLRKPRDVDRVFTGKFKEEYGASDKVYAHMGHLHHKDEKETALMEVIQHPTIAAMDAYASRYGFLSMRRASVLTYHKTHGEVQKLTFPPELVS